MSLVESDAWWVWFVTSGECGIHDTEADALAQVESMAILGVPMIIVPCKKYLRVED